MSTEKNQREVKKQRKNIRRNIRKQLINLIAHVKIREK